MTLQRPFLLFFCALLLWVTPIYAGAGDGWGLGLGQGSLRTEQTSQTQKTEIIAGRIDYQWALSDSFSLTPFITEIKGDNKTKLPLEEESDYLVIDQLGLEARAWMGGIFLGLQAARGFVSLAEGDASVQETSQGQAWGWSLGIESEGGWSLSYNVTQAKDISLAEEEIDLQVSYLMLGFRWR